MSFVIKDGKGRGHEAAVTSGNQVSVLSETESLLRVLSNAGRGYIICSGAISLTTTASYSGILYGINNGVEDMHFHKVCITSTANAEAQFYFNVTTGTLVSAGTAKVANPMSTSNSRPASTTFKIGADASTITDGTIGSRFAVPAYTTAFFDLDGSIIVGTGASLAFEVKPSAAADVTVGVLFAESTRE